MKYGYTHNATTIITNHAEYDDEIAWLKQHKSSGRYNYSNHGLYVGNRPSVIWRFSNPADATLFALTFKR